LAPATVVSAQQSAPYADAVAGWIALSAPPGSEHYATDIISADFSGWTRDATGNLIKRRGTGAPRRVVACGIDDQGFVISEITDAGYLRLAYNGRARRSVLWDQFHEGQRVRVLTASGPRAGVIAVRSTHLWRRRASNEPIVTVEDLWLDIGATSRADVAALGVAVLAPVEREWPTTRFADFVSGPDAAARAGCAAVAGAANGTPAHGETIWIIAAQHAFADAGLAAALARIGHVDTLVLVDPAVTRAGVRDTTSAPKPEGTGGAVIQMAVAAPAALPASAHVGTTVALSVRAYFPMTLVETVREGDLAALMSAVATASGEADTRHTVSVALRPTAPPGPPTAYPATDDSLSTVARLLGKLSDVYAASGHEADMRAAVRADIPEAWLRQHPTVDSAGNLIVAAGPNRDTVVFIAHLDELGFDVTRITSAGTVALKPLGGFYNSLWEGQPALLHTATGTLTGVFIPRASATAKQPDTLYAWFGLDSSALAAAGGATGWATGVKHAARVGATRFTARSIDDRAGDTALLLALGQIDPATLDHKVIFCWSTREEVGLNGAAALAAELGTSVRRVHAVDTFVSSDSPLESPRFALAPIGDGAVVRALDNSSVTPAAEVDRVRRTADAARIPLQVGVTNGGNDGSELVRWGAIDVPLAWPLRYSHSPAELIDLRDEHALAQLVAAMATAPGT
jgi:putative aminopeptidase FrvX